MNFIRLYLAFIPVYIKSKTEYGIYFYSDFWAFTIGHVANCTALWVFFQKFHEINGWNFYEVMLLFAFNIFTYGIAGIFFEFQMNELEGMIHEGTFDGILVKPASPFLQIICRTFGHFFLGDIVLAVVLFFISFRALHIVIDLQTGIAFVGSLLGGILIYSSFIVMTGAANFWSVRTGSVARNLLWDVKGFTDYPITIYKKFIQVILSFVLPFAFINFYPVHMFIKKGEAMPFHSMLRFGTPILGIAMFFLAYKVWNKGINRYQGTES